MFHLVPGVTLFGDGEVSVDEVFPVGLGVQFVVVVDVFHMDTFSFVFGVVDFLISGFDLFEVVIFLVFVFFSVVDNSYRLEIVDSEFSDRKGVLTSLAGLVLVGQERRFDLSCIQDS